MKIPWQQSTIVFIVDKIPKSVSRKRLMKKLFQEKKKFSTFSSFWSKFFLLLAKNYRIGRQNCNLRIFSRFLRENIYFLKLNMISTFFGFWDEKMGLSVKEFFFRVQPTKFRASREKFRWKNISLSKKFSFSVRYFGVSVISLSFCKVV